MLIEEKISPKRVHHYSDAGMMIRQVETDRLYEDAVDRIPCRWTYEETDTPIPEQEFEVYTDHQLMDGDSIDFSTDQTQIPIATGNNTLTVDTAVQPSKVFVKFEG